jgi:hypothetical protein
MLEDKDTKIIPFGILTLEKLTNLIIPVYHGRKSSINLRITR